MWPNLMYGCDDYGHTIMAERISTVKTDDIQSHYKSADHIAKTGTFYDILRVRAQILEAIARKKREISIGKGFRTHKMLLIVDMSGLSLGRVKSMVAAKNAVQMIFSLGSDNYPETMRRIYIVNAPLVFNMLYVRGVHMLLARLIFCSTTILCALPFLTMPTYFSPPHAHHRTRTLPNAPWNEHTPECN